MRACVPLRPLLFRIVEGEAAPAEALRVARHLHVCTACKIVLARESRLSRALEGLADDIAEDPAFVERIMDGLAQLPPLPPSAARRALAARARRRRRFRLALGIVAVGVATGAAAALAGSSWGVPGVHNGEILAADGEASPLAPLGWVVDLASTGLSMLASAATLDGPQLRFPIPTQVRAGAFLMAAGAVTAGLAWLAGRTASRERR